MEKCYQCLQEMSVKIRTVVYSGKVEIDNVPVWSCETCGHSKVVSEVKTDLADLIAELGQKPAKQNLLFNECNEWTAVFLEARQKHKLVYPADLGEALREHIDKLLDLYIVAENMGDSEWKEDIGRRLRQLKLSKIST